MANESKMRILKQKVNGLEFYCEIRGSGPTIALVPSGDGDCGYFEKVADTLSGEFTVFTLDMRYCSRSERPAKLSSMTAGDLASDVAGLLKALNLAPASVWGCSSGGQCVLSMGVYYPEVCRNIMVHEAALQNDTPLGMGIDELKAGLDMMIKATGSKNAAFAAILPMVAGDPNFLSKVDPEYIKRVSSNGEVWMDCILGHADQRSYSAKELMNMPPLVFSVGMKSPGWLVYANIDTAKRANAEVVWFPGTHMPQVTSPDLLAKHIRVNTKKYLR
jgi:pimeloyl-ACP methyl ester carboxylesterase